MGVYTPLLDPPTERPVERQRTRKPRMDAIRRGDFIFYIVYTLVMMTGAMLFIIWVSSLEEPGNGPDQGNTTTLMRRADVSIDLLSVPTPTIQLRNEIADGDSPVPDPEPVPTPSGYPLFDMPRRHLGEVPYGVPIFECANAGDVALTFNDGPSEYTQVILDALDHYNWKGTFFVTGVPSASNQSTRHMLLDDQDSGWPDVLERIHETGHQIASHTYSHARLEDIVADGGLVNQMVWNEMAIRNAIGLVPMYMRPPYGTWRDPDMREQLEGLGYHIIMHNVDVRDNEFDGPESIQKSIDIFRDEVRFDGNGSYIVQMSDVNEWTARKLVPEALEIMAQRGYKGVTVGECLEDEFFYWYRQPELGTGKPHRKGPGSDDN
ncbi:hypothetical protein F5Y02DRAFT_141092 [Annulohypoxylon stygium]|nr:hypothetical protein F5Y02DRAFT_141092 [Annulohypoxylon stygium]